MEMVKSVDFAKYILQKANEKNIKLNLTQLQKILYICDGTLLAFGKNIINEHARAWNYGPVYPKVYKWYSKNMENPDTNLPDNVVIFIKDKAENIVTQAVDKFGTWTAAQLSAWTHKESSPWAIALNRNNGKMNSIIEKDDMRLYFAGLLNVK